MPQRHVGPLQVSALALGCMAMSDYYGEADQAEATATIHQALDMGFTLFDTADAYGSGANEELVGQALRGRRDEVTLATKFGIIRANGVTTGVCGTPEYVRSACDASLRRLGVDHIDLYQQHRVDPMVPIEDTIGALAELVSAGKVRFLGLSEASEETVRRAHAVHPIATLQSEWSLWSRDIETTTLQICRDLGIGILPYSPLGRGFLTGKLRDTSALADGDFRKNAQPRLAGENLAHNLAILDGFAAVAHDFGLTPAQAALAWVLAQGDDVVPIQGASSRAHLGENAAAATVSLLPDQLAALAVAMPLDQIAGDRYAQDRMKLLDEH